MSDLWSVTVPVWLSSIGTVGAFGTGGVILVRELHRDRRREEMELRARAGLVAAWPVRVEVPSLTATTVEARLHLRNGGTEPVYQVVVEYVAAGSGETIRDNLGILPPGDLEQDVPDRMRETWIRTDQHWVRRPATGTAETVDPFRERWPFQVSMRFADTAGRGWIRNADGSLDRDPAER